MSAKGTRNCCCPGTMEPPTDFEKSQGDLDILRSYCCGCIPKQLCVVFITDEGTEDESSVSALIDLKRPCDPHTGDRYSVYRGEMPIHGVNSDVEFAWIVEDEVCYLALNCYATGSSSDDPYSRVEVDDYFREIICRKCQTCHVVPEINGFIEFPTALGTFRVAPAPNHSLTRNTTPCPECCGFDDACNYDEVVAESHQVVSTNYEQRHVCGHCGGCSHVCSCACIVVLKGGAVLANEKACICNHAYTTANGYRIAIETGEEDGDGCCYLVLQSTGSEDPDDFFDDTPRRVKINDELALSGGLGLQCPNLAYTWRFTDQNSTFPLNTVVVVFSCATCAECSFVRLDCCGDEMTPQSGSLPRVITATVTSDNCCPVTVTLIYDPANGYWQGTNPSERCGNSTTIIVECTGNGKFSLTYSGGSCVEQTVEADAGGSCNPVNLTFTLTPNGLGCCQPSNPFATGTLTIEVTE